MGVKASKRKTRDTIKAMPLMSESDIEKRGLIHEFIYTQSMMAKVMNNNTRTKKLEIYFKLVGKGSLFA